MILGFWREQEDGKRKFTEAEIISALKRAESGLTYEQVGRELGVSKHTIYAWKSKFGGMSVSEAQRLWPQWSNVPSVMQL